MSGELRSPLDKPVTKEGEPMTGNDQPERELQVYHRAPADAADRFALGSVKLLRLLADWFFGRRYGHRAVILETVAAVPGMVGGALTHLESLRRFEDDRGWIKTLRTRPRTSATTS